MEDILSRPRALRGLVALRQADPEPMTMGVFMRAVGYHNEAAQALREDLAAWGLVTIAKAYRGEVEVTELRLTPEGRDTADHAIRTEAAALKGRAKAGRGRKGD